MLCVLCLLVAAVIARKRKAKKEEGTADVIAMPISYLDSGDVEMSSARNDTPAPVSTRNSTFDIYARVGNLNNRAASETNYDGAPGFIYGTGAAPRDTVVYGQMAPDAAPVVYGQMAPDKIEYGRISHDTISDSASVVYQHLP